MFENTQVLTVNTIITSIFIGVIIAVFVVAYNKLVLGKFVRALINAKAVDCSSAKSFEQLNVKKSFPLAFSLRKKGSLRKYVCESEEEGFYYIPEDKLYRAFRIYGEKDVSILKVIAVIVALAVFYGIVIAYMPVIFEQAREIAGLWSGE